MDTVSPRQRVEVVFKAFKPVRNLRKKNECETRVELVDKILGAVGWDDVSTGREVPSGSGDYLDYELSVEGERRLVVEAKRLGRTFELSLPKSKDGRTLTRRIQSLQSKGGKELKDVLAQAASYCNARAVPWACVTNGYQWVFFRGLSSKTQEWPKGMAVVFDGPEEILARFDDFLGCLSREWVGGPYLAELVDAAPTVEIPERVLPSDLLTTRRSGFDPEVAAHLRGIGDYLLGEIYGPERTDMLEHCYVEPSIGTEFERNLRRLLKDTSDGIDPSAQDVQEGSPSSFVQQVVLEDKHSVVRHPVVVVGNVGVGKTTFLRRSIASLRKEKAAFYALVDLEGRGQGVAINSSNEEAFVSEEILTALQRGAKSVFDTNAKKMQADPFSRETLRNLFHKELEQAKNLGRAVYGADTSAWDRKELEILEKSSNDVCELLSRYVHYLRTARFKRGGESLPILLLLDNLDQATDEYQRVVYGFCQRLVRDTPAVVVLCMRETTYRRGRLPGGFLTSSPLQFVFHVAAPSRRQLFNQRVKFGEFAIEHNRLPKRLKDVTGEVEKVCDVLRTTLLTDSSEALELVSGLGGHNIRHTLSLVRKLLIGWPSTGLEPTSHTDFLLEALLAGNGGGVEVPTGISNCFDAEPAVPVSHALKIRLLAYYSWAFQADRDRVRRESTTTVLSRFSSWGYPTSILTRQVKNLLREGLLRGATASTNSSNRGDIICPRLMITAAGHVHLVRLVREPNYRALMARSTPWYGAELVGKFIEICQAAGDDQGPTIGDIAHSGAPKIFDAYLAQSIVAEDAQLVMGLESTEWVLAVRAGTRGLLSKMVVESVAPRLGGRVGALPVQLDFDLVRPDQPSSPNLPTIRRDLKHANTVWLPRILWALEWANQSNSGGRTAAEIATILTQHGGMQVPNTNVARAFRDLKGRDAIKGLWIHLGQRYEITDAGVRLLQALLLEDDK